MINTKKCPSCDVSWEHEETITETFINMYSENGIPEYMVKKGFTDVVLAAESTASFHGCRPGMEKHFGDNVIGIETDDYDGVSWWLCTECGVAHSRWNPEKTSVEFEDVFLEAQNRKGSKN